jgi:hypothetical protein
MANIGERKSTGNNHMRPIDLVNNHIWSLCVAAHICGEVISVPYLCGLNQTNDSSQVSILRLEERNRLVAIIE